MLFTKSGSKNSDVNPAHILEHVNDNAATNVHIRQTTHKKPKNRKPLSNSESSSNSTETSSESPSASEDEKKVSKN